jgi:proteasome lid subunit RPN8/RPN11
MRFSNQSNQKSLPKMRFVRSAYEAIRRTVGFRPAESGGLLVGSREDFVVQKFIFDKNAKVSRATYTFDVDFLNAELERLWDEEGLQLLGFLHSHPYGYSHLSPPDKMYFTRQFNHIDTPKFLTPIVFTEPDGGFELFCHEFHQNAPTTTTLCALEIVESYKQKRELIPDESHQITDYSRIQQAVDVTLLKKTHIVGVGAGGAYCLYESLCRSGLGQLTVLDFDTVDASNIVRQGYHPGQVGMLKIDALKAHLQNINTDLQFEGIQKDFLTMNDAELDAIFKDANLILFLTDSFKAQSFGNLLALRYGKPAIWAGYYAKSRCAEIMFTIPGVTPACFRCAVSPRYEMQRKAAQEIKVSSQCNTIFHSQLLDAQVGMLAFAILHNETEGYEYSNWFGQTWTRNLIQFKVHPLHGTQDANHIFNKALQLTAGRALNFVADWQEIEPETKPKYGYDCPDCGGTGNLLHTYIAHVPQY